jgi:hypothetical protein
VERDRPKGDGGRFHQDGAAYEPFEPSILHGSLFGDCFDVLTDRAPTEALARYPRVMLLGGVQAGPALLAKLRSYVEGGGELLVSASHVSAAAVADPLWGAAFEGWVESPGVGDDVPFSLRLLKPTTGNPLRVDNDGRPVLLENRAGKGRVVVCAARNYLGGAKGNQPKWLPAVTEFLKTWIAPVWPVQVNTLRGQHPPQVMLNKLKNGWLITLGNHRDQDWWGEVSLDLGGAKQVELKELWRQAELQPRATERGILFYSYAPRFSFKTYAVRMK